MAVTAGSSVGSNTCGHQSAWHGIWLVRVCVCMPFDQFGGVGVCMHGFKHLCASFGMSWHSISFICIHGVGMALHMVSLVVVCVCMDLFRVHAWICVVCVCMESTACHCIPSISQTPLPPSRTHMKGGAEVAEAAGKDAAGLSGDKSRAARVRGGVDAELLA